MSDLSWFFSDGEDAAPAPVRVDMSKDDAFDAWVVLSVRAAEVGKSVDDESKASAKEANVEYAARLKRIANALYSAS